MSLEALSRGARGAFISDANENACEIIKRNAKKARLFDKTRVVCSDYVSTLRNLSGREKFGIVFLDPPYNSNFLSDALVRLNSGDLVAEGGFIVCESDSCEPFLCDGFSLVRHAKYGKAFITVLRKDFNDEN